MKTTKTHFFRVAVTTEKDIPNLADVVGGRLWSIDGVVANGITVEPGAVMVKAEPVEVMTEVTQHTAHSNGHAADNQPQLVNMDECQRIAQEALDKKKD